jgi:NhaA family Na+:H+ antiporter
LETAKDSTSSVLQHFLHKPVGFDTSSFALANTAIVVSSNIGETIAQHYSIGML